MLQVIYERNQYRIEKTKQRIIMHAPEGASAENREKALKEWYRGELKRVLPQIFQQCEEQIGVKANACNIKYMKTRWGSCNVDEGRILINLQLVHKPIECLEYVVTHELVHLLEKNHTNRFRALVEKYYPNWKEAKQVLREMPLDPLDNGDEDTDAEYDRLAITIPKGRKETIDAYAKKEGTSINGLVNCLLREKVGMTEDEWKRASDEGDA